VTGEPAEKVTGRPDGEPVTVELWVWADRDCLDADLDLVMERAITLAERGVVDAFSVAEWDHQVDLAGSRPSSPHDHEVRRRLAEFDQWARTHGVSLPLPPVHRGGVGRMGPEVALQDLPMLLLVEYVGENIAFVSPCEAGGRGCSVEERLDRLTEAGAWVSPAVLNERTRAS
jgi:hypothetical protein